MAFLFLLFLALLLLQTPAAPPRDVAPASETGTFVIRGRVVDAVTGQPITGAEVSARLVSNGQSDGRAALTDADGKWQITGLVAGDYTLSHGKLGYNRKRGVRIYSPVHVSARHPVRDIELVLLRGGVITGRVMDITGEPAPGVQVMALRVQNDEAWQVSRGDTTDDRGQFRLYGLEPGDFYISASPDMHRPVEPTPGRQRSPVVTYYPGTTRLPEAERITLGEQAEISDLTFQIQTASTVTVSGRIVTSRGSLRNAFVNIHEDVPRQVTARGRMPGRGAMSDGRFAIGGVLPGEYVVAAQAHLDDGEEIGEVRVWVEDQDVEVTLPTHGPALLSGRVSGTPGVVLPFRTFRVSAFPTEPVRSGVPFPNVPVQADGTFQIKSFGSRVRLRVFTPADPLAWRVRDVIWKGTSVMHSGVDAGSAEGPTTGIDVIVVGMTARLQGNVRDAGGSALKDPPS